MQGALPLSYDENMIMGRMTTRTTVLCLPRVELGPPPLGGDALQVMLWA